MDIIWDMVTRMKGRCLSLAVILTALTLPVQEDAKPALLSLPFDEDAAKGSQHAWSEFLVMASILNSDFEIELILIPPGVFTMGFSPDGHVKYVDQMPHSVQISRPFYLSRTEVTQNQWYELMRFAPWDEQEYVYTGESFPASFVSYIDAVEFCNRLSLKTGLNPYYHISGKSIEITGSNGFRLPTEAEWEYACRAGSESEWQFQNENGPLDKYAWFNKNAYNAGEPYPHRVAQKSANAFGLYDMHGNVWEWCFDWYGPYAQNAESDPTGRKDPDDVHRRVIRGGSYSSDAISCRSFNRSSLRQVAQTAGVGFRVARNVDDEK